MAISLEQMKAMSSYYKRHLTDDIMSFWEARTKDEPYYGYLTQFDREGNLIGTEKNMWDQGRQLWMFSALYNDLGRRPNWLELADWGRQFIVRHGYAGSGRWHYILDRQGAVMKGPVSIYTDMFVLSGLCEYALAAGTNEDERLIQETFDSIECRFLSGGIQEIAPQSYVPGLQNHGPYMIGLNMISTVRKLLGNDRVAKLRNLCLDKIMNTFVMKDTLTLYESVDLHGNISGNPAGRLLNPGHTFESMWFCMEEYLRINRKDMVELTANVIGNNYLRSQDRQFGGIFYMIDADGGVPQYQDWVKGRNFKWDEKVSWVHNEALYAMLIAAFATKESRFVEGFMAIHDYCHEHFFDAQYGEWYDALHRDGKPRLTFKGGFQKSAYHLPRALLKVHLLLEYGLADNGGWHRTI